LPAGFFFVKLPFSGPPSVRGNPAPATRKSLLIEKLEDFFHGAKNESEVFREWTHEKRQSTRYEWRLFLVKPVIEVQRPKGVNPPRLNLTAIF
jgi:hypothetical protein